MHGDPYGGPTPVGGVRGDVGDGEVAVSPVAGALAVTEVGQPSQGGQPPSSGSSRSPPHPLPSLGSTRFHLLLAPGVGDPGLLLACA